MKIFTNGCYDILHPGHIELFKYAKTLGDYLVVGIDSDQRVSNSKGSSRPINKQEIRKYMLLALKYVDEVFIFNDEVQLTELVKAVRPDIMIVGSDWKNKRVIGSEYAKEVRFFERIQEFSTTKTIESITNR
jgi:D-beta-D-heptose 7-phosphate kinase/D-beta-D-heptose 1-phosphate adenosyltransferase